MLDCAPGTALPAPTPAHLAAVQDAFEVAFPDDYLRLVAACNGGVPLRNLFRLGADEKVLERFLPLLEDAAADEVNGPADVEVVATQLDARLTDDPHATAVALVPVAALFAGDLVVLDYRGRGVPRVGVWDHEASDDFAPVVHDVAPTVSDFLRMLRAG